MIKHVLFLDDDKIQNKILLSGLLRSHPISYKAKFDVIESAEFIVPIIKTINLDLVVLDYYLSGATSSSIAASIRFRQPQCKIWLYSGYNPEFLPENERDLFDRCIEKDRTKDLRALLCEIEKELDSHKVELKIQ